MLSKTYLFQLSTADSNSIVEQKADVRVCINIALQTSKNNGIMYNLAEDFNVELRRQFSTNV